MTTINQDEHQARIALTHSHGFGSSDAAMIARIGKYGLSSLSNTNRKRIAVAFGLKDYEAIPSNSAMTAGHLFEDEVEESGLLVSEYSREHEFIDQNTFKFWVFAHADYLIKDKQMVIELKFSKKSQTELLETYKWQLQWYYLFLPNEVVLVSATGETDPYKRTTPIEMVKVERDQKMIDILVNGLELLNEAKDDFTYEENTASFKLASLCERYDLLRSRADELAAQADELKVQILEAMEAEKCASIKNEYFTITYASGSVRETIDAKAILKAHPEINADDYKKATIIKSTIVYKNLRK